MAPKLQVKERCFIFNWNCKEAQMDTDATVTSSLVTVYKTIHDRNAVSTLSPLSIDRRQYVEAEQDKVTAESITGRTLPLKRYNSRRNYRPQNQPQGVRDNEDVKRDIGAEPPEDFAQRLNRNLKKRETFLDWLKRMFKGGERDKGMNKGG